MTVAGVLGLLGSLVSPDDPSSKHYEGDPVEIGSEKMDNLHPGWGKQDDIGYSKCELGSKKRDDRVAEGAEVLTARPNDEPYDECRYDKCAGGVDAAETQQHGRVRVHILSKGRAEG